MAHLISYEIAKADAFDYTNLYDALQGLAAVWIMHSTWMVPGRRLTGESIYEALAPCIKKIDRLFVCEVSGLVSWDNLKVSDAKFLALCHSDHRGGHPPLDSESPQWRRAVSEIMNQGIAPNVITIESSQSVAASE
jgi:hypothetical protein